MAEPPQSILHALNQDALEEVAAHCDVASLLKLQQTCRTFAQLLAGSERVWFRKLAEDYGLHLKVGAARQPGQGGSGRAGGRAAAALWGGQTALRLRERCGGAGPPTARTQAGRRRRLSAGTLSCAARARLVPP